MKHVCTLRALFSFPGFVPSNNLIGIMGDPKARIVTLKRRGKKDCLLSMSERLLPPLR